ncbi:MAG: glycosyltransferase [Planctomycetota bacterium]
MTRSPAGLPPVTVVVTSFAKAATLRACLDAVLRTDYPDVDVLVVDSGSSDGTLELLAQHYPGVRVDLVPGASLPAALNRGFARAAGRDVVRLHGDVVPQGRDWLQRLAHAAMTLPKAGVVGVKLVHANGRIQSLGRDIVTGLGFGLHRDDRRAFEYDDERGGEPAEVDSVRGACAYYRRSVLEHVQLDEAYAPAHGDDDDFCLAARYHGFKVWVEPGVTAVHYTPHRSRTTSYGGLGNDPALDAALTCQESSRHRAFAYFQRKWGFDPLGPDLHEVRRRYGHTEICWRVGGTMRYRSDDPQPAVDVAFATCNSAHLLPRMLAALAATRWPRVRVFAVDNGSTDGTLEILDEAARTFPYPLHVHRLPVNTGVVPAVNLAFSLGTAPLVARLDDDAIVAPDWLERMVPRFAQRPFAGVVGPRILHGHEGESLQVRPVRVWPQRLPVLGDGDPGAFDVLMRVATLCGCCNLYRRDALARVGLFDVRYAPTQYDDTDHHFAMANAGYEILHDGAATVRHWISQGRAHTHAAIGNVLGNQHKLTGKWADAWTRLDRGIDLSREGRVLPPDGDTSGLWAALPPPEPPRTEFVAPDAATASALATRNAEFAPGRALDAYGRNLLLRAERALADGAFDACTGYLWVLTDAFPHLPEVLALQARRAAAEGDLAVARRALARALALRPDDEGLRAQAAALRPPVVRPSPPPLQAHEIAVLPPFGLGDADREGVAGLLVEAHSSADGQRGVWVRALGVDLSRAAVVHAFDLSDPVRLHDQVKAARVAAPRAHIVLSPWLSAPEPEAWAAHVLPAMFRQAGSRGELDALLAHAARGQLEVEGSLERRRAVPEPDWLLRFQRAVLACVDKLVLFDDAELDHLAARFSDLPPHQVLGWPHPARDLLPDGGAAFARAHGLRDFVLLPGPLQPEHNQLVALHALADWPCVVLGPYPDPAYAQLCREFAGAQTVFLPELPASVLHSALQAARLVAFPTFRDRLVAPLARARLLGTPVLCAPGGALARGLGACALPVDPCDVAGMRQWAERALGVRQGSPVIATALPRMEADSSAEGRFAGV